MEPEIVICEECGIVISFTEALLVIRSIDGIDVGIHICVDCYEN